MSVRLGIAQSGMDETHTGGRMKGKSTVWQKDGGRKNGDRIMRGPGRCQRLQESCDLVGGNRSILPSGQADLEGTASAWLAGHKDHAAVSLHNGFANSQAQPCLALDAR